MRCGRWGSVQGRWLLATASAGRESLQHRDRWYLPVPRGRDSRDVAAPAHPAAAASLIHSRGNLCAFACAVVFSPDGRLLAVISSDQAVTLWDVTDPGRPAETAALAISSHDALAGPVGARRGVQSRRSAAGHRQRRPDRDLVGCLRQRAPGSGHHSLARAGAVSTVAFSPDGRLLAAGSPDKTVQLWRCALTPEILGVPDAQDLGRWVAWCAATRLAEMMGVMIRIIDADAAEERLLAAPESCAAGATRNFGGNALGSPRWSIQRRRRRPARRHPGAGPGATRAAWPGRERPVRVTCFIYSHSESSTVCGRRSACPASARRPAPRTAARADHRRSARLPRSSRSWRAAGRSFLAPHQTAGSARLPPPAQWRSRYPTAGTPAAAYAPVAGAISASLGPDQRSGSEKTGAP